MRVIVPVLVGVHSVLQKQAVSVSAGKGRKSNNDGCVTNRCRKITARQPNRIASVRQKKIKEKGFTFIKLIILPYCLLKKWD